MATPTLPKTQTTPRRSLGRPILSWLAHDIRTIKNPSIFYSGKYIYTYLFFILTSYLFPFEIGVVFYASPCRAMAISKLLS